MREIGLEDRETDDMTTDSSAMKDVMRTVVAEIDRCKLDSICLVAVTGVDGVGKTTFCASLETILQENSIAVRRATIDSFHNPKSLRHSKGRYSSKGFYEDSFDFSAFEKSVLKPAKAPGVKQLRLKHFDLVSDEPLSCALESLPEPSVLLVDGIFLLKKAIVNYWDLSIYLDAPFDVTFARLVGREGYSETTISELWERYVGGQKIHLQQDAPKENADIIINVSDFTNPSIEKLSRRR